MTPKPLHKSLTFWLNIAAVVVVAVKVGLDSGGVSDPDVIAILVALMNILNRLRTVAPVVPGL